MIGLPMSGQDRQQRSESSLSRSAFPQLLAQTTESLSRVHVPRALFRAGLGEVTASYCALVAWWFQRP